MLLSRAASAQATIVVQRMAFKIYVVLLPDGFEKLPLRNQV